ncbi:MAG TPA: TonB family protein, partial [Afipia sp.]
MKLNRALKFTIWHGIAVSLALHSAFAVPFIVQDLMPSPDDPPLLVIDLQGVIADNQTEQKVMKQVKGAAPQQEAQTAKPAQAATPATPPPPDDPPKDVKENGDTPAPPPPTPAQTQAQPTPDATPQSGAAGYANIKGAEEKQIAQKIRDRETEQERINAYVKLLSKKVRANLVYPDAGRPAAAMVSFTILSNGQIRPDSLKIAESSGQTVLDRSALETIRASAPFDPPPHE